MMKKMKICVVMLVLAVSAMAYATPYYGWQSEETVTAGTVGLYHFNESSGNAYNAVAGGLRLYKNGAMSYAAGKFGNGGLCPGTGVTNSRYLGVDNWQIEYSAGAGMNMDAVGADPSLSVAIWIKPNILPTIVGEREVIFDKCASNNPTAGYNMYLYYDTDNHLYLKTEIGTTATTPVKVSVLANLVSGQWTHLAIVWDAAADTLKLYQDGTVVGSTTSVGSVYAPSILGSTNPQLLRVGERLSKNYGTFSGMLDDLKVNNIVVEYAVPEPATIAVLSIGLLMLKRRK